jgi:probable O-glycosylation ligase (exosortase A-associated)
MRFLLVLCCVAGGSAAAAFLPIFCACIFLWHDLFQPLTFAYRTGEYPLAIYCEAVLVLGFVYHAFRGTIRLRRNHFVDLTCVFLAWIFITAVVSSYPSAWTGYVSILKYLVPMLIVSQFVRTPFDAEMIMATMLFSIGIWAAAAGVLGPIHGAYPFLDIEGGQMTDNNEVAAATVGYVPFLVYFIFNYRWRFRLPVKLGLSLFLVITLSSIAFSQSRGAAVSLGVLAILYIIVLSRRKIRDFTLVATTVALALYFAPESFWKRISTINMGTEQTEASAHGRMELMHAAWLGSLGHPIFGMGPGCWLDGYAEYIPDRHNPHDIWLKCSVETGFPGLALFAAVILTVCYKLIRLRKAALSIGDQRTASIAMAIISAIVGVCAALSFLSQPYWEFLWAILATGGGFYANYMAALPRLRAKVGKAARPSPSRRSAPPEAPRPLPAT